MIRTATIVLGLLLAASASAQSVRFPSVAVGASAAGPEITGWMYRPSGAGPFPGLVLAHNCGGVSDHTTVWGKRLAGWGYVVVAPDSFGTRGEKSVCGRGNVVSGNMRVSV
jgi:dienelactone hydrolase